MQLFTKKNKGFTLIELLVVIAIIGILASIVLVSLGGARAKARDATRQSDLRQIQLAQEMYYDSQSPTYYATSQWALVDAGYLPATTTDPSIGHAYCGEATSTDCTTPGDLDKNDAATDPNNQTWGVCVCLEADPPTSFGCTEGGCQTYTTGGCDCNSFDY